MTQPELIAEAIGTVPSLRALKDTAWRLTPGTITTGGVDSVLVQLDGEGLQGATVTVIPAVSLVGFVATGARVMIMSVPPSGNYVIAPSARYGVNQRSVSATFTPDATRNIGIFGDMPGISVDFTKRYDETNLKFMIAGSAFSTGVNTELAAGVTIDSTDYIVAEFTFNNSSVHHSWAGFRDDISGVVAGTYTFNARWSRPTGGGTLTMNADDRVSFSVEEVPAAS